MTEIKHRRSRLLALAVLLGGCGGTPAPRLVSGPAEAEPPPPPALELSAASLRFTTTVGVAPAPQVILVTNGGGGELAPPTAVLDTDLFAATVEGAAAPYTVTVTAAEAFVQQTFTGTLTIASAGAANGPLAVPLALAVEPALPPLPPTSTSCWVPADSMCQELASSCGPALEAFAADCTSGGHSTTCPADGRVGGCRFPSGADVSTYWYFAPAWTEAGVRDLCGVSGGAWVAPGPGSSAAGEAWRGGAPPG